MPSDSSSPARFYCAACDRHYAVTERYHSFTRTPEKLTRWLDGLTGGQFAITSWVGYGRSGQPRLIDHLLLQAVFMSNLLILIDTLPEVSESLALRRYLRSSPRARLCGRHFRPEDYEADSKHLRREAVPRKIQVFTHLIIYLALICHNHLLDKSIRYAEKLNQKKMLFGQAPNSNYKNGRAKL